jgi:hypothetical protein
VRKLKPLPPTAASLMESNALSQFWRPARDGVSRLWIFDQTVALKSVGRSGRGRLARALRSSSKRDSFILLYRTTRQTFPSSYLLSYFNERKGLIPQNSDHFFKKTAFSHPNGPYPVRIRRRKPPGGPGFDSAAASLRACLRSCRPVAVASAKEEARANGNLCNTRKI